MMLLMGMKMSLTKKPTNPMTTNPIAVRAATLVNSGERNSVRSGLKQTGSKDKEAEDAQRLRIYPCGRACGSA